MTFIMLPADLIDRFWHTVGPMLEKAVEYSGGRYAIGHVKAELHAGVQQLWLMVNEEDEIKAAITTKITVYPLCSFVTIVYAGGEQFIKNIEELDSTLEEWGKQHGCVGIESTGRTAWRRVVGKMGYREAYATYERKFDG